MGPRAALGLHSVVSDQMKLKLTTCGIAGYRLRRELPVRYDTITSERVVAWVPDVSIRVMFDFSPGPADQRGYWDYAIQTGDAIRRALREAHAESLRPDGQESLKAFFREWLVPLEGTVRTARHYDELYGACREAYVVLNSELSDTLRAVTAARLRCVLALVQEEKITP